MKVRFSDAIGAAIEAAQGFRGNEYGPFFLLFAAQLVFLALTTQMQYAWAMVVVAPIVAAVGGEGAIHYPSFFGYLPVVLGWVESFLYTVPGSVLIPLALLRMYARTDRALSLGAGLGIRLGRALVPTLLASLAAIGAAWAWQRWVAPTAAPYLRQNLPPGAGEIAAWAVVVLGGYLFVSLLLYVPIAAVQARSNFGRALGYGIRFGLRALPFTLLIAVLFGLPALAVQYVLESQGAMLITRVRPESISVLLAVYAFLTSVATYMTYGAAARLYRMARGDD